MAAILNKADIYHSEKQREYKVNAITKRSVGKIIIEHCGNEGQKDDETLAVTPRQLLQRTINLLDMESESTWTNAEITIYDQLGNKTCIRSGKAENKFVVELDEKDEIKTTCIKRKLCYPSWPIKF